MGGDLERIEHIIVLMLENRSFDHMLGYLTLEEGRTDVRGLRGGETNTYQGQTYPVFPISSLQFHPLTQFAPDPDHSHAATLAQVAGDMGGFVAEYAARNPAAPGNVMGYYNKVSVPVYDFLAQHYLVCDHWFASFPGSTLPNRLFSLAGNSDGEVDNKYRLYKMNTLFDLLRDPAYTDTEAVNWRYYSQNVAILRFFENYTLDVGRYIHRISRFYSDLASGDLPSVSWIDPKFTAEFDLHHPAWSLDGNDDHPPTDITYGQQLVQQIYNHLLISTYWHKSLLILVYDEHGGFYDSVTPPAAGDPAGGSDPRSPFRRYGVRVPAFVISPLVTPGAVSHTTYDHATIIKTILNRFCRRAGPPPDMGARVRHASDLSSVLSEPAPRADCPPAPQMPAIAPAQWVSKAEEDLGDFSRALQALVTHSVSRGVGVAQL